MAEHNHDHSHGHGHHHQAHHHGHEHHHGEEGDKMMGQDKFDADEVAVAWTTDPLVVFLNEKLHDSILQKHESNFDHTSTTVLDFGCGTGLLTKTLAGKVNHVTGVDVSKAMIKVYNHHAHDHAVGLCEDLKEPYPAQLQGKQFDYIISCYALHHVEKPSEMVSLLATYLKPGGTLIFGEFEPTPNSPKGFFKPGELSEWMASAGLANSAEEPAFQCKPEELPESKFGGKGDMFTKVIIGEGMKPPKD
jgi:ubiquinone/menaquinone biosynthesis C-methylase UbiE